MAKRHNLQKMAAFNLGVSEAVHHKKRLRDTDFHVSFYISFYRVSLIKKQYYKSDEDNGGVFIVNC